MAHVAERAPGALHRRSRLSPLASFGLRVALAFGLIGIALLVHWLDRDGLRDNSGRPVDFVGILYFTMITITTVGYGDIVPVTEQARLFDTFVLTPIRLFVWLIFLGTAYDFLLRRTWQNWRMAMIQRTLSNHVVVAGCGVSGQEAVGELIARGVAADAIVAIDGRAAALEPIEALGATVLEGDATRNTVLETARIAQARALVVSSGRDDTSILIVLTARRLAPDLPISVVIRSEDNEALARQAGATTVINPVSFAGLLLAGSTHGPHIADYMADLASTSGPVALHERPVAPAEIGRPLAAVATGIALRLYRNGAAFGPGTAEAQALAAGDMLVEVVQNGA